MAPQQSGTVQALASVPRASLLLGLSKETLLQEPKVKPSCRPWPGGHVLPRHWLCCCGGRPLLDFSSSGQTDRLQLYHHQAVAVTML